MLRWLEFRDLQRRASAHQEPWEATGRMVYSETEQLMLEARDNEIAAHVALVHNNFGAVCNLAVRIFKLWRDAVANLGKTPIKD